MPSERMADSPPATSPEPVGKNRTILIAACALAGVWILGLFVLVLTSANPVTLNQEQIEVSDAIVTAVRSSEEARALIVQKEWLRGEELGEISVMNLGEVRMPEGEEFLVPLQRLGGRRYRITPTALPNEAPLIYPATEEAKAQLAEFLEAEN